MIEILIKNKYLNENTQLDRTHSWQFKLDAQMLLNIILRTTNTNNKQIRGKKSAVNQSCKK